MTSINSSDLPSTFATRELAEAQIISMAVPLVEVHDGWSLPAGAAWLSELFGPQGSRTFSAVQHRDCPGHAAAVREAGGRIEVAYLCLDPERAGHIRQTRGRRRPAPSRLSAVTTPMTEEQKAERRRVFRNNRAWEAAAQTRRQYVTGLLIGNDVPEGTLRYVAEVVMTDPGGLAAADGDRVAALVGQETHPGAWDRSIAIALAVDASETRIPLVLLAQVAASVEARFGEHPSWRHPTAGLVAYLRFLASSGYQLSEIEQEVANP
jgi:ParB family chromosome partitioning protein